MRVHWKTMLPRATVWLMTEAMLSLLGLDSIADYSEFLLKKESLLRTDPIIQLTMTIVPAPRELAIS
jgi:hypothetical protein